MKLKKPTGIRFKTFDGGMTSFLVVPEPGQIITAKELDVRNIIAEGGKPNLYNRLTTKAM